MTLTDAPPPYGTIVFDCDSTLSDMEGIEDLAGPEHAREIGELTAAAMDGTLPLEEVFGRRLELVQPTRADVEHIGRAYVEKAIPGVGELMSTLLGLGKRLVIVSGGLLPAVRVLALHLGIEEVYAVDVSFDEAGAYAGFDDASPLARAGGKIEVLEAIRAEDPAGTPLAFIGDGATDLEAAHLASRFIAYGGVARRDNVFSAALVSSTARDLRELAPLLLSPEEAAAAPSAT